MLIIAADASSMISASEIVPSSTSSSTASVAHSLQPISSLLRLARVDRTFRHTFRNSPGLQRVAFAPQDFLTGDILEMRRREEASRAGGIAVALAAS